MKVPNKVFEQIKSQFLDKFKIEEEGDLCARNNTEIEHVKDIWREIEYDTDIKVEFSVYNNHKIELVLKVVLNPSEVKWDNNSIEVVKEAYERSLYLLDYLDLENYEATKNKDFQLNDYYCFKCRRGDVSYKIIENKIAIESQNRKEMAKVFENLRDDFFRGNHYMQIYFAETIIKPKEDPFAPYDMDFVIKKNLLRLDRSQHEIIFIEVIE